MCVGLKEDVGHSCNKVVTFWPCVGGIAPRVLISLAGCRSLRFGCGWQSKGVG